MEKRGLLYQDIISCLNRSESSKDVERLIRVGARYIRKRLELFNIYFEPGRTLEDIVLTSETPHKELDEIMTMVYTRVGTAEKADIAYGAIVAVYLAAHENREAVVPLKNLLKYYPYVKPVLGALAIYADYGRIVEIYERTTAYGHI